MPLASGMRRSLKTMSGEKSASTAALELHAVTILDLTPMSSRMSDSDEATSGSSSMISA